MFSAADSIHRLQRPTALKEKSNPTLITTLLHQGHWAGVPCIRRDPSCPHIHFIWTQILRGEDYYYCHEIYKKTETYSRTIFVDDFFMEAIEGANPTLKENAIRLSRIG